MLARWRFSSFLFTCVLLLVSSAAIAQTTTQQAAGEIRRNPSASSASNVSGPSAMRVATSLAGVLALIVILFMAARRFLPRSAFAQHAGGGGGGAIQMLARTAISPKQRILLLQVGRRILIVADGGPSLTTLAEITDAAEAAALIAQLQSEKPTGSFGAALSGAMEKFRAAQPRPEPQPSREPPQPNLDSMREEIEGLAKRVRGMAR
jgi:flagellar biogenesis protein FliO